MPLHHGLSTEDRGLYVRFALLGVLDALTRQFSGRIEEDYAVAGKSLPLEAATNGLTQYARSVVTRLLLELDQLQRGVDAMEEAEFASPGLTHNEKAGVFAESVLHSINALAEVMGMTTLLALGEFAKHEDARTD